MKICETFAPWLQETNITFVCSGHKKWGHVLVYYWSNKKLSQSGISYYFIISFRITSLFYCFWLFLYNQKFKFKGFYHRIYFYTLVLYLRRNEFMHSAIYVVCVFMQTVMREFIQCAILQRFYNLNKINVILK